MFVPAAPCSRVLGYSLSANGTDRLRPQDVAEPLVSKLLGYTRRIGCVGCFAFALSGCSLLEQWAAHRNDHIAGHRD